MQDIREENISYTQFILVGFPDVYEYRKLLFIPFFMLFVMAVVSNCVIIYIIQTGKGFSSPMYLLICAIAFVDLGIPITFVPKMLLNFLFDWNDISLTGCLVQMFFIHFISSFESTILMVMALDRYVAICMPLRYNDYINSSTLLKLSVAAVIRSVIFVSLIVIFVGTLSFCWTNIIKHCYCEHMAVVGLACGDTTKNSIVGLVGIFSIIGVDLICIFCSYIKIFTVVLKSSSVSSRQKAIHTCTTHLIVILTTFLSALVSFIAYRIKDSISINTHNIISVLYQLLPCCFNPVIYGVRTKEIRQQIFKMVKGRNGTLFLNADKTETIA
ncbi:olfactory receptor 52K1-like [Erpetoichthys calabaricus]|uniref:olfactory receptor 52K1-like n=1 Tax=Erpetoichthys calabaricus TaxID=27687 RepID=UPI00109EF1A4|nr:olfactory receptor 52K1-like [Erpetoichthys calabaricus]